MVGFREWGTPKIGAPQSILIPNYIFYVLGPVRGFHALGFQCEHTPGAPGSNVPQLQWNILATVRVHMGDYLK